MSATKNTIEEDYYACLNLSREVMSSEDTMWNWIIFLTENFYLQATQEEITSAYRNWSRLYHPDKHTDAEQKKKADLLFSKIKQAYEGRYARYRVG